MVNIRGDVTNTSAKQAHMPMTDNALVLVVRFGVNATIVDDEFESEVHEATVASIVMLGVAIYKLLL